MTGKCDKHGLMWGSLQGRKSSYRECPACMQEELDRLRGCVGLVPEGYKMVCVVQATAEPCSKCGNTGNKILYIEECLPHPMAEIIPEHLIHTCTCCEYQWNTPPQQRNQKEN